MESSRKRSLNQKKHDQFPTIQNSQVISPKTSSGLSPCHSLQLIPFPQGFNKITTLILDPFIYTQVNLPSTPNINMLLQHANHFDQPRLKNLAENMLRYANRTPVRLNSNTKLDHQALVDWANTQLCKENELIKQLGQQANCLIVQCLEWVESSKQAFQELKEEIQVKTLDIQNLQEALSHLQKIVATYRGEYMKVKAEVENLAQGYKKAEDSWNEEKECLIAQIKLISQELACTRDKLEILANQKQQLQLRLQQEILNLTSLSHDLNSLNATLWTQKQLLQLQQAKTIALTKEKDKLIASLQLARQTIENIKQGIQNVECQSFRIRAASDKAKKSISRHSSTNDILSFKFKQDLPYSGLNRLELSCIRRQPKTQIKRINNDQDCFELDPYFAHFVLTSQSVKIKEDCEDLLNYDIKPYYSEIVDKRIPMHLWDQWIRNKLRQLKRLAKNNTRDLTSEDDTSM